MADRRTEDWWYPLPIDYEVYLNIKSQFNIQIRTECEPK